MLEVNKSQIEKLKFVKQEKTDKRRKRIVRLLKLLLITNEKFRCKISFKTKNHGLLCVESIIIGFTKKFILLKGGGYIPVQSIDNIILN